jgi:hypothetical protein
MTTGTRPSPPSPSQLSPTSSSQNLIMPSSSIPSAIASRLPPSLGALSDLTYTRSGRLENAATGRQYFVKLVSGSSVLQTQGESEGLRAVRTAMGEKEGTFVPDLRVWDKWEENGVEKGLMISGTSASDLSLFTVLLANSYGYLLASKTIIRQDR